MLAASEHRVEENSGEGGYDQKPSEQSPANSSLGSKSLPDTATKYTANTTNNMSDVALSTLQSNSNAPALVSDTPAQATGSSLPQAMLPQQPVESPKSQRASPQQSHSRDEKDEIDWAAPLPAYDKAKLRDYNFMEHDWCCAARPEPLPPSAAKALWPGDEALQPNKYGVIAAAWAADGDRKYMEDRHKVAYFEENNGNKNAFRAFFAVFDGHGGPEAADFAAHHMADIMYKHVKAAGDDVETGLIKGFKQTERDVLINSLQTGASDGCTACTVSIIGNTLWVANAGDSRCVLARDGKAVALSTDHRPDVTSERHRIEANGGQIEQRGVTRPSLCCFSSKELKVGSHRLWPGGFSVSRALGNINYKLPCRGRVSSSKILVADPEIIEHRIAPDDQFVIVASDGFWDAVDNEEAVKMVLKHQKSLDVKQIAEKMVAKSYRNGSNDNITVLIAFFTHI